ncbi:MAG: phosphoglycerate kinase [Pikeienuella sp.]
MSFNTLDDMDLSGKRALIRVDINAPFKDGKVTDDTRLRGIVQTVHDVIAAGGKPVLLAHFGRPKGQVVPEMSLAPLVAPLAEVLGIPVGFCPESTGGIAAAAIAALPAGEAILLENARFNAGEESKDAAVSAALAAEYAALGDVYVNDAFSVSHRAHASVAAIAHALPACAGRLMQKELEALNAALGAPKHPVIAVVGGAKVSTKLELLGALSEKVDQIIIGGGMANTFLAAHGHDVGKSLCEHDMTDTASAIIEKAADVGCEIVLPTDVVVAREFAANAPHETVSANDCPADAMILDAGPKSIEDIAGRFEAANTVVWNGPLGAFELTPFNTATDAAALKAAALTQAGELLSVAGGGDTVAALNASGAGPQFSYVSTAGGAFLEWMEGKILPGVAALEVAQR